MSKRALIYARVSTDEQAEQGYGLIYQIDRCTERATLRGYTLVHEPITDDYTGKTAFRPGMNELLDLLEPLRVDVVLIHRTDRLGRRGRIQDLLEAEIEARGACTEYITADYDHATPQGRTMRRMQGVFDELDYDTTIEKLKEHRKQAVKSGSIVITRPPYGYRVVKEKDATGRRVTRLVVEEEEAQIVRMMFEWYLIGDETGQRLSINGIAERLSAMRLPTRWDKVGLQRRTGYVGRWSTKVIHYILSSETYVGRWHYGQTKRVPVPGTDKMKQVRTPREAWICVAVPPIVDEATAALAWEQLAQNIETAKRNRKYFYLFTHMLKCSECGASYAGHTTHKINRYYRCCHASRPQRYARSCTMPYFNEQELDAVVWPWVKEVVQNPELVINTLRQKQALADEQNARLYSLLARVDSLIAEAQAEQQRVMTLYKKSLLTDDRWAVEDAACQKQIAEQEKDRADLLTRLQEVTYSDEYIRDVQATCAHIARGLDHFTTADKHHAYTVLRLHAALAIEDGMKVAHAECVLGTQPKRLEVGPAAERAIAFTSSASVRATADQAQPV